MTVVDGGRGSPGRPKKFQRKSEEHNGFPSSTNIHLFSPSSRSLANRACWWTEKNTPLYSFSPFLATVLFKCNLVYLKNFSFFYKVNVCIYIFKREICKNYLSYLLLADTSIYLKSRSSRNIYINRHILINISVSS